MLINVRTFLTFNHAVFEPPMMKIKDLPITPVDSLSPIPLYYQIEADLKQLIRSEKLPAGALLPPELDLCRAYGVGRHTMRVAIGRLVTENLVERFAGRGTFVKQPADRRKFLLDRSFTRQMAEMGLKASSKVLDCSPGEVDESAPAPLQKYMGAACLNLIRLRLGDGHPIGLQFATILTERCPNLEENDFAARSMHEILMSQYQLYIREIASTVSAVVADDFQARLLQTAKGAPLLLVNTTSVLENGEIIECTISYYRADRYEFSSTDRYYE